MSDSLYALQLRDQRVLPALAHILLLGIVYLLTRHVPSSTPIFLPWAVIVVLIMLARAVLWGELATASRRTIAIVVRTTMLVLGLTWGIGVGLISRVIPAVTTSLLLLGLAGLLAGALTTLMTDRWAFTIYAVALVLPVAVALAVWGTGEVRDFEILLLAMFVAFTSRLHARTHAMLVQRLDAERQLASAQAIAHVGSWEWDITTNVVTWSDELRRIYGVAPRSPVGYAEFLAVAHPDDRARLETVVAEGLRTREPVDYEWRAVRPDGTVRHILGRNVIVADARGQALRMAGTSFDITERKLAEDAVKVLQGILPICASCKRIRNEDGIWEAVELYVRERTDAEFSHGLCPACAARDWGG
jgi:PAS domain S-box-containing protein